MAEAGKEVVSRRCMIRASMLDASARALAASARALHRPYSPSRKAVLTGRIRLLSSSVRESDGMGGIAPRRADCQYPRGR